MNGPGDNLLSRAALAVYKYGRICVLDFLDQRPDLGRTPTLPYERVHSPGRIGKPLRVIRIDAVLDEGLERLAKESQKFQVLLRIRALPRIAKKTDGAGRPLIPGERQTEKTLIWPNGAGLVVIPGGPVIVFRQERTFLLEDSKDDFFTCGDIRLFRARPGSFKDDLAALIEKHEPGKTRRDFFADDLKKLGQKRVDLAGLYSHTPINDRICRFFSAERH
jgi:hypothetical protein